jgi:putative nucleotidyltransferase with HDIG domain
MTLMGARDLRFRAYAVTLASVAAAGFALSVTRWPVSVVSSSMVVLATAVLASELLAVELAGGASLSLAYPLLVCAVVLLGPSAAGALAILSMAPLLFHKPRMSGIRLLGNLGQATLTALVPGWLYLALGGQLLADTRLSSADFQGQLLPLLVAATAGVVVNGVLFSVGYALVRSATVAEAWRVAVSWAIASQVALGLMGLAIARVMSIEGPLGFALFVVPLLVARQTYRRYLSLRETYADTVRSLVAALEAKDQYTKGHSVRVARIAVAVAGQMGFDDVEVERIEYAALLHDLGKIGISRSVLSKPGALTDEEFDKIRQHPDIAARILESIPFLDDVRPIVQDHHERVDGLGYGRGLTGDHMSTAARILAVADGYDAMTAERPYRAAMSERAAVKELRANAGTQFDPAVVEVLIAALPGLPQADGVLELEPAEGLVHA